MRCDSCTICVIADSTTGLMLSPAARAPAARLSLSEAADAIAPTRYRQASHRGGSRAWRPSNCSSSCWLRRSMRSIMASSLSTTWGSAPACACSARKVSWRWWTSENGRRTVAIRLSSCRPVSCRSRRLMADIRPSMADAATPATEVPNDRPRPLIGSASAERMACRSVEPSNANTAPLKVTTMPRKVPSIPSMTSRPTRYGVSAGPGRPPRSPSMRDRTALRSVGGTRSSQSPRLDRGWGMSASAARKGGAGRAVLPQLPCTEQIDRGDHRGHDQGDPVRADESQAHPGHGHQADGKGHRKKTLAHC